MADEKVANRRLQIIFNHLIRASVEGNPKIWFPNPLTSAQETAQHFKYTLDNGCLSLSERQFYEDNGYLVVKSLVKEEELKKYARRYDLSYKIITCNELPSLKQPT